MNNHNTKYNTHVTQDAHIRTQAHTHTTNSQDNKCKVKRVKFEKKNNMDPSENEGRINLIMTNWRRSLDLRSDVDGREDIPMDSEGLPFFSGCAPEGHSQPWLFRCYGEYEVDGVKYAINRYPSVPMREIDSDSSDSSDSDSDSESDSESDSDIDDDLPPDADYEQIMNIDLPPDADYYEQCLWLNTYRIMNNVIDSDMEISSDDEIEIRR